VLLQVSRSLFPFIRLVWADGGYNHGRVTSATNSRVAVVSKIAGQTGFVVLPRCWFVEPFFAWINRNRRLAKDAEATLKSAAAFLYAAASMLMIRRLAQGRNRITSRKRSSASCVRQRSYWRRAARWRVRAAAERQIMSLPGTWQSHSSTRVAPLRGPSAQPTLEGPAREAPLCGGSCRPRRRPRSRPRHP
jgi:hypothetical protein